MLVRSNLLKLLKRMMPSQLLFENAVIQLVDAQNGLRVELFAGRRVRKPRLLAAVRLRRLLLD